MARHQKHKSLLPTNRQGKLPEITYKNFQQCARKYLKNAQEVFDNTNFAELRCNKSVYIENKAMLPLDYFSQRKAHNIGFTAEDISNAFDVMVQITNMFNEKVRYVPTLMTFCRVLCISTSTFNTWVNMNDERGEQARLVQDYFRSTLSQGMLTNEINPTAGAFIGKSTLGMKDSESQQVNINIFDNDKTVEEILADYAKNILTT